MHPFVKFLYVAAFFVVPFVLGYVIARTFRVKDMALKLGGILLLIGFSLAPFINQKLRGGDMADAIKLGIDLAGGTNLVYQLEKTNEPITSDLMNRMVAAITKRINPAGTKEIVVRQVGQDRIEVIIPGANADVVKETKNRMTTLGSLEFGILANRRDHRNKFDFDAVIANPSKTVVIEGQVEAIWREIAPGTGEDGKTEVPGRFGHDPRDEIAVRPVANRPAGFEEVLVIRDPEEANRITGKYLRRAYPNSDQAGNPAVGFQFNSEGATLFSRLTSANVPMQDGFKRRLAILLDNRIVTAPSINSTIGGEGIIEGNFTAKEVDDTVAVLNSGSLPREIKKDPISEFTISPTLGTDVQTKGKRALIVSMLGVILFMGAYYLLAGAIANFAMILNLLFIVSAMVFIDAAFTLPGLAGLVLSAGMAVDANVLIYERIREETSRGASLRMAIHNGFEKAFAAIFDSNITTLITSVILYMIGTETVKGFAVSLFIGLVMNLYTAVYVSRIILTLLERSRTIKQLKMFQMIGQTNFDFVGKQLVATMFSLAVILAGFIALFARGKENFDIDFTGGTMIVMQFEKPQKTDTVRGALEKKFDSNITLEELKLADDTAPAGEGVRYRLRTTEPDDRAVERKVHEAFPDQLVKLSLTPGKVTAIAAVVEPKKTDGKAADAKSPSTDPFAGGNQVELTFSREIAANTVSRYVLQELGNLKPEYKVLDAAQEAPLDIQGISGSGTTAQTGQVRQYDKVLLKTRPVIAAADLQTALANIAKHMQESPVFDEVTSFESSIASDARTSAFVAILLSLVAIIIYLWFRFENLMFGMSAAIAVAHDVLFALSAVALCSYLANTPLAPLLMLNDFKINMPMIAAFLTIVGYSLNDTIVIFDRLREIRGKNPVITRDMINLTVNQCLGRTILTALTVFISVLILYLLGGEGIHGFAFCMVVGTVAGTYSTVYIASPLVLWFVRRELAAAEKAKLAPRTAAANAR